ncbi:MAG: hypothetical protein PHV42_01790 [Candidatus Pacebacteria bacterium]|nr:hypothetical protein [Candidatus Paceibacterota bacterium]
MNQSPYNFRDWKEFIPDIESVIRQINQTAILSVGITPYTRIIPAFFLNNYSIYTIHRSSDVDIMESYLRMHILSDYHPAIAKKIHGTGYLIGNHVFQAFLRSFRPMPKLMFYTMTEKIAQDLNRLGIPWIGNDTKTFEEVKYKGTFRVLVKKLGLPALPSEQYGREAFLGSSFEELWEKNSGAFVVQRADKETGGNEGTFFIHTKEDFVRCVQLLQADADFQFVVIAPFIVGQSTSMLGCVMPEGTLSGPLQLQLIDVPQSLHGVPPNGIFFGNDLGFTAWEPEIEVQARKVVEGIGAHLSKQGYKGIFGIDFLYDKKRNKIYPNECNPRFTGSLTVHSLMMLELGVPPLELFHLMAHLNIKSSYDFEKVNMGLRRRLPCAHIAFSPQNIPFMNLPLLAGVYSFDPVQSVLSYKGPGISLADIKGEHDFLLIDTVPSMKTAIEQKVPRLFKFIFKRSIAKSSYEIDKEAGYLLERFSLSLIEAAKEK